MRKTRAQTSRSKRHFETAGGNRLTAHGTLSAHGTRQSAGRKRPAAQRLPTGYGTYGTSISILDENMKIGVKGERRGVVVPVVGVVMKVQTERQNKVPYLPSGVVNCGERYAEFAELELEISRKQIALNEARKVYERTNIEARDIGLLRHAEDRLQIALKNLRVAKEREATRVEAEEHRERWRKLREPPSLQQLVFDHGTYDKITQEVWAKFDADMAEWKQKMREGYFDHVMDRP